MMENESPKLRDANQDDGIGFEPIRQLGDFRLTRLPDVAYTGAGAVRLCGDNALRQALFVNAITSGTNWLITPFSNIGAPGFATIPVVTPAVIHAAIYPVLCQGPWYGVASAPTSFAIYELTKA